MHPQVFLIVFGAIKNGILEFYFGYKLQVYRNIIDIIDFAYYFCILQCLKVS